VPFDVLEVLRDGRPEPHFEESQGKYQRLNTGNDQLLPEHRTYTYTIRYRTARQLGFFEGHDELYWNVTGNDWVFPMETVTARVVLPPGIPASALTHEAYTGPLGAKGKDYISQLEAMPATPRSVDEQEPAVESDSNTPAKSVSAPSEATPEVVFRTTRPLQAREGLTIVVTFPKGVVQPPAPGDETVRDESSSASSPTGRDLLELANLIKGQATGAMRPGPALMTGVIGLIAVLAYFLVAWALVGRDPPGGTIIPLFEPPRNVSPAAARYLLRMGYDLTCFTAGIVSLAVKGHLLIEDNNGFTLTRHQREDAGEPASEEGILLTRLMQGRGSGIRLVQSNHKTFQAAQKAMKQSLAAQWGSLFRANRPWFFVGFGLAILAAVAMGAVHALFTGQGEVIFLMVWLSGWSVGVTAITRQVVVLWHQAIVARTAWDRVAAIIGAILTTAFSLPFWAGEIAVLTVLAGRISVWAIPLLLALAGLTWKFRHWLKRPSPEGRAFMDQIEGFRMYLGTAERDTLLAARAPARTPELFEKYLPYAIAFGVESAWAASFARVLAAASVDAAKGGYRTSWYRGRGDSFTNPAGFASTLGSSFAGALRSASTAPGSRSGRSGGGSSGGGGGGGGGGGR
jgi:uncharacterized membrane protein YgcG